MFSKNNIFEKLKRLSRTAQFRPIESPRGKVLGPKRKVLGPGHFSMNSSFRCLLLLPPGRPEDFRNWVRAARKFGTLLRSVVRNFGFWVCWGMGGRKRRRVERPSIHPRNKYSENPPDFALLASLYPSFKHFVFSNRNGRPTIDWTDFNATRELTRVLLLHDHGLTW